MNATNDNMLCNIATKCNNNNNNGVIVIPTLFGLDYSSLVGQRPLLQQQQQPDEIILNDNNSNNNNIKKTEHQKTWTLNQKQKRRYDISSEWYRLASSSSYKTTTKNNQVVVVTPMEIAMIQEIGEKVHQSIPNFKTRAAQVPWGGADGEDGPIFTNSNNHEDMTHVTHWWYPTEPNRSTSTTATAAATTRNVLLSQLEGGYLLYAYLVITKWNPNPHFPFRLCEQDGCPVERAIAHTLEFREKYQPFKVSPSVLKENKHGYVYHRGFSPIHHDRHDEHHNDHESPGTGIGRHGTVFVRLDHKVLDTLSFFRGILHSVERAISDALVESNGAVGKFNVIFDCQGFSLSNTPSLQGLKQGITMLQDHYPNHLGMIYLFGLSRTGEMFLKMVLKLITKEVRDKVKILPFHNKGKTAAILKFILEEDYIPVWMGGRDTYKFNVEEYYPAKYRFSDEESRKFLTTMPYHAM